VADAGGVLSVTVFVCPPTPNVCVSLPAASVLVALTAAWIVQGPFVRNDTTPAPLIEHTAVVRLLSTGVPYVADAPAVYVAPATVASVGAVDENRIELTRPATLNVCSEDDPAANVVVAFTAACSEHCPLVTKLTSLPLTVHTAFVLDVMTGVPCVAVALTAYVLPATIASVGAADAIATVLT